MLGEVNGAGIWRVLSILRGRQRRSGKDQPSSSKEESHGRPRDSSSSSSSSSYSSGCGVGSPPDPGGLSIRVATFNAAMFAMAPAVEARGEEERSLGGASTAAATASSSKSAAAAMEIDIRGKIANDRPRGILKQSSAHVKQQRSLRVSINLPDDEISSGGGRRGGTSGPLDGCDSGNISGRFRAMAAAPGAVGAGGSGRLTSVGCIENQSSSSSAVAAADNNKARGTMTTLKKRSVVEVLREVGADVVALQNVRAEEEKGMRPLSELAEGLGMPHYVFAESWAPDYGNAILSRWPIKRSWAQRIADDSDFRNVLKATIEVPRAGELNLHCTHLDHLDESWRMKQVEKILETNATGGGGGGPHILAGGLNALDQDDYSAQRWAEIVNYYEDIGKPSPKPEVMRFLRQKRYVDARNFASELEQVVVAAKGQAVQGTCNYGTRVDYILASPDSPYRFVPGSYMVLSSTGTSDHHIVRVDVKIAATPAMNNNQGVVGAAAAGGCSKGHNCSRAPPPHQQPHWLLPRPAGGRHQQQPQHVVPVNNASTPSKGPWI